jgi:hypothetical protein
LIDLENKEVHDYQIVSEYHMQHWLLIWGIEVVHDSIWNGKELGAFEKYFKIEQLVTTKSGTVWNSNTHMTSQNK